MSDFDNSTDLAAALREAVFDDGLCDFQQLALIKIARIIQSVADGDLPHAILPRVADLSAWLEGVRVPEGLAKWGDK